MEYFTHLSALLKKVKCFRSKGQRAQLTQIKVSLMPGIFNTPTRNVFHHNQLSQGGCSREFIFTMNTGLFVGMYACIKYCKEIRCRSFVTGWYLNYLMCVTYISWGLNLWMRAQRAMPLFQEVVKSVITTFLQPSVCFWHQVRSLAGLISDSAKETSYFSVKQCIPQIIRPSGSSG